MSERPVLQPSERHPITIAPNPARVVVTVAGQTVADTTSALTLQEAEYPPVSYVPVADVDFSLLEASDHDSYCPFKGDASYFSVPAGGEGAANAVWQYREPFPAVAEIEGHVAFYPDRVEIAETD